MGFALPKNKVSIGGLDAFLHTSIIGPTGSGKSSRVIKPMIFDVLKALKAGKKVGLTLIEPKGDLAADIAKWCEIMGIPHVYVDPLNPNSHRFNPMQGDPTDAAESTRTVLKNLFGKQEAFFSLIQENASRNTVLLLKHLEQNGKLNSNGKPLDLNDVIETLRNPYVMKRRINQLKQLQNSEYDDLVEYFQVEILGTLKNEYQKFAMGLRAQLEDIAGNKYLKHILSGHSDIDLDKHLKKGGVLIVNTEMGKLGKLGDAFGMFIIQHLQNAVFRRPGNEWTRTPHYLFIDEVGRYINPDFERLLAIGRSFRCATTIAFQSRDQLEMDGKKNFPNIVLQNTRNKIVFGGLDAADAEYFEKLAGKDEMQMRQSTYKHRIFIPPIFPEHYRDTKVMESRLTTTEIMEIKAYHFLHILTKNGQRQKPGIAKGKLIKNSDLQNIGKARKSIFKIFFTENNKQSIPNNADGSITDTYLTEHKELTQPKFIFNKRKQKFSIQPTLDQELIDTPKEIEKPKPNNKKPIKQSDYEFINGDIPNVSDQVPFQKKEKIGEKENHNNPFVSQQEATEELNSINNEKNQEKEPTKKKSKTNTKEEAITQW